MVSVFHNSAGALKIGLINLNHSRHASAQLCHDIISDKFDIVGINEPYFNDNGVAGFSNHLTVLGDGPRSHLGPLLPLITGIS